MTKKEQLVGADGGVVSLAEGAASIEIPAGALSQAVTITAEAITDVAVPEGVEMSGGAVVLGPEGQTFDVPVTVVLPWVSEGLPAGKTQADLVVYTSPADGGSFTALPATVVNDNQVSAQTNHFSIFFVGVAVSEQAPKLEDGGTVPPAKEKPRSTGDGGNSLPPDGGRPNPPKSDAGNPPPPPPPQDGGVKLPPPNDAGMQPPPPPPPPRDAGMGDPPPPPPPLEDGGMPPPPPPPPLEDGGMPPPPPPPPLEDGGMPPPPPPPLEDGGMPPPPPPPPLEDGGMPPPPPPPPPPEDGGKPF